MVASHCGQLVAESQASGMAEFAIDGCGTYCSISPERTLSMISAAQFPLTPHSVFDAPGGWLEKRGCGAAFQVVALVVISAISEARSGCTYGAGVGVGA